MNGFHSRAVRSGLGVAVVILAACADEPAAPFTESQREPQLTLADPFTVTNTGDSGIGSLRWVVSHTTGGETVRFDPALAGMTIGLDSAITIRNSVTIEGPAGRGVTIDAKGKSHVLLAWDIPVVALRNLTITGGNSSNDASAVWGPLHVILENSLIHGNTGHGYAAIFARKATIINSTISGNTTTHDKLWPVVWSWNIELINSTVAHNNGGGVGSMSGNGGTDTLIIRNSVIANNAGRNCTDQVDVFSHEGANISDDDTCGGPAQITITDPKLGALADNGGPSRTHALLPGSPAINAGTACTVQTDQRYFPRDAECDLGAFEFADFTTVAITVASSATFDRNGFAVLSGTVRCSRNETFDLHVTLQQLQKQGPGTIDVHAVATTPVFCTTSVLPWSVALVTTAEPFQNGDAAATVATMNAAKWVTPTSVDQSVRLFRARK